MKTKIFDITSSMLLFYYMFFEKMLKHVTRRCCTLTLQVHQFCYCLEQLQQLRTTTGKDKNIMLLTK